MDFYKLLKLNNKIKSPSIKLIGIFFANIFGIRHLSIRIDPALSCNLSCVMCYYSSSDYRKSKKGSMQMSEMEEIARVLFPRSLQVIIGCGAEPTLNKEFLHLAFLAKKYKVPHVGIVTNGQLIEQKQINEMLDIGLNEIALSAHGVTQAVYEKFMVNANYYKLIEVLNLLEKAKVERNKSIPKLRINYTVNSENLEDLSHFFEVFGKYSIELLQIRPQFDMGGAYFKPVTLNQMDLYEQTIHRIREECKHRGIVLLANISDTNYSKPGRDGLVAAAVYCYISPNTSKELGFNWKGIKFNGYMKSVHWHKNVLVSLFSKGGNSLDKSVKYEVYD